MVMQIDSRGRVTLPPEVRELLNVQAGDDLVVTVEDGRVVLESRRALIARLQGSWVTDDGRHLVDELIAERRDEAAAEVAEIEGLRAG